ncbi:MAG TPA: contractile injection system tape measure protein, partial [Kofleriaceae bacterium]|nr:contractile injection system tape measure protein [Kofleriaceae bacterium]
MAAPRGHVLGRLVIEPAVATPARLASLWNRLGRFGAGPLAAAIDEVMSRLVAPDEVVQLDRLELDIGRVREDHLEDDLITGVRRALEDALRDRLGATAPLATAPAEPRTLARRLAESVGFVAVHGALPWWHAAADPDELDALIRAALAQSRDETRRAVLRAGQLQSARRRLALQLATATLHELVRLIEAGHAEFVIDYVLALEREHAQRPIVPATGSELRVAAWELVLAYLIVDRGLQFNHKRFVAATVAGLAQRFGLDYAALLRELRRGLPRVARAAEPLHQLLDELWYELDHALAPDAAAPLERGDAADDAQIAQLDALLRRGLPPVGAPTAFDDAFRALRHDPGRLRWVILAHWHRDRVRQRLGERPDELLIELVHVVLPSHAAEIVSYGRALDRAHAARPVIAADAARFRRTRWRFFLDTLMLQHGSAFNTRAFIRATLERLAAHDNTTYDALVAWLWRELAGLPRSATSAHPVVLHLGALYRELRTRGSARHDEATAEAAPRGAMAAILDRVAPQDHALARAVLRFVGTLPELATCAFGRGLGSRAIAAQVQQLARAVLGSSGDRRLRSVELLDGLLTRIAEASAVPRDEVLRWALRRKARLGSVRDEVRGLVEQFARAAGLARAAPAGPAAPGGNDDPARALTGWLLRGAGDAHTPRQAELAVWLDQLERGGNTALRARIAELLRDAPVRRRVVATAGNAALVRLWAWRR